MGHDFNSHHLARQNLRVCEKESIPRGWARTSSLGHVNTYYSTSYSGTAVALQALFSFPDETHSRLDHCHFLITLSE